MPGWPLGKQILARNKVPDKADKGTVSLGSVLHREGEWNQSSGHENQSHLLQEARGSQMLGRLLGLSLPTWGMDFPWLRERILLTKTLLNGH